MQRNKILILQKKQFGYHIDTYYYCKYLKERFDVTYMCWDYGLPKVRIDGVRVKYIPRRGNKIMRYSHFLYAVLSEVKESYDIYFLKYFIGCSLLKLRHPKGKYVFDVRTGDVSDSIVKRTVLDTIMRLESLLFDNITVISMGLAAKFGFPERKVHILPLGAEIISENDKSLDDLNLLYVGTLENRNIEQTVRGFDKFYREYGNKVRMNYKIIGSGYKQEEQGLLNLVREKKLDGIIQVLGFIPHKELGPYFDGQNVGVSYVPVTDYFDSQPPTKTFEYILSGMPVIATATSENRKVVNSRNGVLIDDNAGSFCEGLKAIFNKRKSYKSVEIRETCKAYTWENIVGNNLGAYLASLVSRPTHGK